jgi:hypothetical protein
MEKKRKEERIRTLNINRLSAMGAAIPVSRSECDNEIIVLQGATTCAEPAIGIIIGRWIRKHIVTSARQRTRRTYRGR